MTTKDAYCYTWTEAEGKRGGIEILSCVVRFLEEVDSKETVKHVILYSDTCGGQSRNKIFATAIIAFLKNSNNINTIEQKFLISGHTQMEADSMHGAIETVIKTKELELPSEFLSCMRKAHPKKPYNIHEMKYPDFMNYAQLNQQAFKSNAFSGIITVHHIKYSKWNGDPIVQMSDELGCAMRDISYRKRGGQQRLDAMPAYTNAPGIPQRTKDDLLALVPQMANHSIAQLYYQNLPVSAGVND